jgi:molybdenum cofactor guanylyltransferase
MASLEAPPGLILAGGKSSRMGIDKAMLTLGERTIIAHVIRRLTPQVSEVSINAARAMTGFESLPLVKDTVAGQLGPLAGILSGMRYYAEKTAGIGHFLTVPCDSPFLPLDLAGHLAEAAPDAETIVVASSLDRSHPVFALWPVALADELETWLADDGNRRINAFLSRHRTVMIDFPPVPTKAGALDPFLNINTPDDLAHAALFSGALA